LRVWCTVGPDFWGLVNPEWILCSKGKRQSPISIDATTLLFDPYLAKLHIDPNKVYCQYSYSLE